MGIDWSTLAQGGSTLLFIAVWLHQSKVQSENLASWQSFISKNFDLVNNTSQNLTKILSQYSNVMAKYSEILAGLSREVNANTESNRRMVEMVGTMIDQQSIMMQKITSDIAVTTEASRQILEFIKTSKIKQNRS